VIPEIGHYALVLALAVVLVQTVLPLVGALRGIPEWVDVAFPAATVQLALVVVAYACLTAAFLQNDFSVAYVAQNSNTLLPAYYRVSAVWGGHEGSLLLWILMLSGWTFAVSRLSAALPRPFTAKVLAVMGFVTCGFLLFTLLTSNPFDRLIPPALEGRDLNPLLQDIGLIIHPPLLYMGYVGLSVVFAFAIAALIDGRLDAVWARWSRPWTVSAWAFLTLGIMIGSWWAYYELGWGGWWFWDPVENASFMPWLVATALLHSLAVTEKRGAFKAWTVLLAICAFSLSLLGTFLVRSGVLNSVHAFATDPARGVFILGFLSVVIGGSLALYAWRAPKVVGGSDFSAFSRETLLLSNNVLLAVATVTVLLGTLYPLIVDALGGGMLSVGPPYFNAVFVPLVAPLLVLIGIGPIAAWRRADAAMIWQRLRYAALGAVVLGVGLLATWGIGYWGVALAAALAGWVVASMFVALWSRLQAARRGGISTGAALRRQPLGFYGMLTAHVGVAFLAMGAVGTTAFTVERDVRMVPGERQSLSGYAFEFQGVQPVDGPNYRSQMGTVNVFRNDRQIASMRPEKRLYLASREMMTEAGISAGFLRDLYVSLGEPTGDDGAWTMRLHVKPLVRWIWLGALLMALGGFLAVADRRYRTAKVPVTAKQPGAGAAGERTGTAASESA